MSSRGRWNDVTIGFHIEKRHLDMNPGEFVIGEFSNITNQRRIRSDVKGNIIVTNLRIIWHEQNDIKVNLSIGFDCIREFRKDIQRSRLHNGTLFTIHVISQTVFPYIFLLQALEERTFTDLYQAVTNIHRAYRTSKIYRTLVLRGLVIKDGEFQILQNEHLIRTVDGFWNLSGDMGNLGKLYITNIRIVWVSNINDHHSASIPYLQIKRLIVRNSKFGSAMAVDINWSRGNFVYGFQTSPLEELKKITDEINILMNAYLVNPIYGIFVEGGLCAEEHNEVIESTSEEDAENDPTFEQAALEECYWDNKLLHEPGPPTYSHELGLAIETLPKGKTIQSLWNVL
ncbi:BBSome complex member BBS5-like [Styela clava]